MLTKVEVRTPTGMLLTLPLDDASEGFVVEDIDGLDPVKATLVSSSFALLDGAQYQSSRLEPRNILITIGLEPDYVTTSVRDLRTTLYDYFLPKSLVSLRFFLSDGLTVDITGYVESFNAELFTRDPQAIVSLMCFDPDFVELTPIVIEGDTVSDTTETLVSYPGTAPAGMKFVLSVDRTLTEFTIYHRDPSDNLHLIDVSAALEADDVVTINTNDGLKSMLLVRDSVESSILYGMNRPSEWLNFTKGDNHIRFYAIGAAIPYTVEYTPRHGGL